MKKKIMTLVSVVLMAMMICGTQVFATQEVVYLELNQNWNVRPAVSRSGKYNDAYARCNSVYPPNGQEDTFTKIQAKLCTTAGTTISDVYTLSENDTSDTSLAIRNGYLYITSLKFAFRGNNPNYNALALVTYSGR